nr:hypothetical protein CFP56_25770 [Quercus suber]
MPALLLQRRTCALDRWGTYVTRIEANGKAGSLLDFLRHPGGVVERKIGCRCRSHFSGNEAQRSVPLTHLVGLVTQPSALGDDFGHLVHLSLRTTECPEPLLREFSRTLVLAVTEQFNHAAFVWGETVIGKLSESRADVVRSGHGRRTQKLPSQRRERKQFSC